jgi:hypothetical protein
MVQTIKYSFSDVHLTCYLWLMGKNFMVSWLILLLSQLVAADTFIRMIYTLYPYARYKYQKACYMISVACG